MPVQDTLSLLSYELGHSLLAPKEIPKSVDLQYF